MSILAQKLTFFFILHAHLSKHPKLDYIFYTTFD